MKKYLGIEFGSTRIKANLIDDHFNIIASGVYTWENSFINNIWTYSLEESKLGLKESFKALKREYENKYNEKLIHIDSIGISGMMHGYLILDKNDKLLTPFRTWRNSITY